MASTKGQRAGVGAVSAASLTLMIGGTAFAASPRASWPAPSPRAGTGLPGAAFSLVE